MFISKDTESLPHGFTRRCELLKGSTYSQCPFVSLGSSPAMDDAAGEPHVSCRTWNLVMEISSQHRATCSPFSQAGTRSQLGHTPWHANSQQQQRGTALHPLAPQSTCAWCAPREGSLTAARAQFKGLSEANQIPASIPWLLLFLLLSHWLWQWGSCTHSCTDNMDSLW